MDMAGRMIYQNAITDIEIVIPLEVANGIYSVRLIAQNGKMMTKKVSINR
jgi:hypothetical protein